MPSRKTRSRPPCRGYRCCALFVSLCYGAGLLCAPVPARGDPAGAGVNGAMRSDEGDSGSDGWSVDLLPSPTRDPVGCGRPERQTGGSFVCDPDRLLTQAGAQRAEDQLEAISVLQSPCGGGTNEAAPQGIEGGVAVVSRMLPSSHGGVGEILSEDGSSGGGGIMDMLTRKRSELGGGGVVDAEEFARGVHDSWRVGKMGCDNGFLLVASREERSFAISVGKGLEKYLTPRDRNAALNAMKPLLRNGDWDAAVLAALEEIAQRLERSLPSLEEMQKNKNNGGGDSATEFFLGKSWKEFKRRAADGPGGRGWGGGGDSGDGSGGGGGGGGTLRDWGFGALEKAWADVTPGSTLLALSLLWGGARLRSSIQRRRYDGFEAKLAGIEAQRAMVTIASGGWTVGQDALASPGACPICLNPFSAVSSMGEGGTPSGDGESCGSGGGLKGADGLATASLPCGHAFCRSCLDQWHEKTTSAAGDAHEGSAPPHTTPCPICDEATPVLGDPRLGRHAPRAPRRPAAPRPRPRPRPSRRRGGNVGYFGFKWPGGRGSVHGKGGSPGGGASALRFSAPVSSGWDQTVAGRGMLRPPPPPPPPSPPTTPLRKQPPGGMPDGPPLTPVGADQGATLVAPTAAGGAGGAARGARGRPTSAWLPAGTPRPPGGERARERARREAAFRLASLASQYPKFLDDRTVNRWLSKDYSSSWSRDPLLEINRPPDFGGAVNADGSNIKKGSGWVSSRPRDGGSAGGFGGEKKSYGGGCSSSATAGGW